MVDRQPLSIVIRIPDVTLSRSDLETALGLPLDRYEQPTDHASGYAQIDIPDGQDQWAAAVDCVRSVRDPIQRLVSELGCGGGISFVRHFHFICDSCPAGCRCG